MHRIFSITVASHQPPVYDEDSSTHGVAPKRKFLKRTVQLVNPDGTTTTRVDIIKDPVLIRAYIKNRTALGLDRRAQIAADEQRNLERKERRRLQEQLRRLKKSTAISGTAATPPASHVSHKATSEEKSVCDHYYIPSVYIDVSLANQMWCLWRQRSHAHKSCLSKVQRNNGSSSCRWRITRGGHHSSSCAFCP